MEGLDAIIAKATAQLEGGFSAQSDALTALHLVIDLARALQELRDDVGLA